MLAMVLGRGLSRTFQGSGYAVLALSKPAPCTGIELGIATALMGSPVLNG